VHVDLPHQEKVAILLKMHIVQHSLAMMQSTTEDVVAVLARLVQSAGVATTGSFNCSDIYLLGYVYVF
jgi:hypothetical protein